MRSPSRRAIGTPPKTGGPQHHASDPVPSTQPAPAPWARPKARPPRGERRHERLRAGDRSGRARPDRCGRWSSKGARARRVDRDALAREGRLLVPVDHPDPAHLHVTGTGLTHLGSASTRDAMHKSDQQPAEAPLTDSMKMFRMGLEGGKPKPGEVGVQPEWFYKGNGYAVAAPGAPIPSPAFAKDAGEEPEIAGIYVIGKDGTAVPRRLRARQRVFRPRDRAGELPVPRALEAALLLVRAGAAGRRTAAQGRGHLAHPPRRQGDLGKAVPLRRGQHEPHHRQPRIPPLQVRRCSASRATCTCTCSALRR